MSDVADTESATTWRAIVRPICLRLDLFASLDQCYAWNPQGQRALSTLLKEMARLLDDEVKRRAAVDDQPG